MVGIFSAGYFADKFGRKGALQFSHIFAVLAAIFFGIARPAGHFELLIVGRLIIGFSTGNC
jgi:MFS family permease